MMFLDFDTALLYLHLLLTFIAVYGTAMGFFMIVVYIIEHYKEIIKSCRL